jgi:PKHD-type hydroxylase
MAALRTADGSALPMTMPLALLLLLLLASPRPAAARRTKASKQAFETPAAFTPAECGRIIAAASGRPQEQAVLHDGKGGSQRDVSSRDSTLAWLDVAPGSEMRWVLERMEAQLPRGESAWGVRSLGLGTQGIQVARYGPGHHYEWHTDSSAPVGGPTHGRIMSVTVQLSAPDEYTGGMVEMGTHGNVSTAIGTMALFPSFLPHKVHRVSSGVRYSIVAWFAGASPHRYAGVGAGVPARCRAERCRLAAGASPAT